jgi:protein-tyrosine phosphatase
MTRATGGKFSFIWGQPTYTLQDIEKTGGICVDQAYYSAMIGKGRGIPTLYFSGQGVDGGHAWFGYLSGNGKWNLDCGRYANQNFAKGYALDPQTWHYIDDTELDNFFKNGDTNPNYQPACNAIDWAILQGSDPSIRKILDDARSIMPELAQTWRLESAYLENTNADDDDKKAFYQSWIAQFSSYPDMKVRGQKYLLQVLKKDNDPDADSLQQDIILANRGSDFDAGIQEASSTIMEKITAGDWDGARTEYETTIRDFGDQGGGTLFDDVISPYVKACLNNGHADQADDAITFTEDRMPMGSDTVIAEEFSKLKDEVADQKKNSAAQASP